MSRTEFIYGLIIIALILYVLIDTILNGRGSEGIDTW